MDRIKFVANEPALMIGKTLIISDLHLGIEHVFYKSGIHLPSQTEVLAKRLDDLIARTKANRLIIIGDVKHKVPGTSWQEEREIPLFFSKLSKRIKTEIVLGNHDPGIERLLPKEIKIHPTEGFLLGDFYLTHGHAWPSQDIKKAKTVIIGHNQPMIELRDKLGYRWIEKAWVVSKLNRKKLIKKYKGVKTAPELVVMPAFNDLAGGICFNREKEFMGPIIKNAGLRNAKIYLLDGTYLGELKDLVSI